MNHPRTTESKPDMAAANHPHKGRTGIIRVLWAARHSLAGLRAAYVGESAFRQEVWLATVLVPAAFWLGRSGPEIALLLGSLMLVLIVELLNSAIEAAIDRISYEHHDLSKRAKDIASAAVMLSLIWCTGVWAWTLLDRVIRA
jgi:diacylglycerol kinase (ATP)